MPYKTAFDVAQDSGLIFLLRLCAIGLTLYSALAPAVCRAETMSDALSRAYLGNPMLNQQRAATRAADEGVSKAEGALRPHIDGSGFVGYTNADVTGQRTADLQRSGAMVPQDGQVTLRETVFDGNRNINGIRHSESLDFSSRERLRLTEQETLLAGATAYMDVLRDLALAALARNEITVLEYELRGARARAAIHEITFTDVAQVATSLAQGRSRFYRAQAALETSIATFRRVVGVLPHRLEAAAPVDAIAPASIPAATTLAFADNPRIAEAMHDLDASETVVKLKEGGLYPTVDLVGKGDVSQQRGDAANHRRAVEARVDVTIPFYTGGTVYAEVRRAKEQAAAARLRVEAARDQVRASVMSSFGQAAASKSLITSSKTAVAASEVALTDVRTEASMGQRTTYDVLLAIQALFKARAMLISAQRDRVVTSYQLVAAAGRLSAETLKLGVVTYDPTIHFAQVKDKWFGLRTPDGR